MLERIEKFFTTWNKSGNIQQVPFIGYQYPEGHKQARYLKESHLFD